MANLPTSDDIEIGDKVLIEKKEHQGTGKLTEGIVKRKLTSGYTHPYGIKVDLESGEIGRVKENLSRPIGSDDALSKIEKLKTELEILKEKKKERIQEKTQQIQLEKQLLDNPNFEVLDKKIIPKTEDALNEFKEFYQYDEQYDNWKKNLQESIWKEKISLTTNEVKKRFSVAVASFGNSFKGGFLYLGINSKGEIVGLERDKEFAEFNDYEDTFANSIRETLENFLHEKIFILSKLQMEFTEREGKMICIIQILPADEPLWIYNKKNDNGEFFVRGPSPRAEFLNTKESLSYIKGRFPNSFK